MAWVKDDMASSATSGWGTRRLVWGMLLLNTMVMGAIVFLVVSSRLSRLSDAQSHVSDLTIVEQSVADALIGERAQALTATQRILERRLSGSGGPRLSLQEAADLQAAQGIGEPPDAIFDAAGHQVCPRHGATCRGWDVSGQAFYARLRDHPERPVEAYGVDPAALDGTSALLLAKALQGDRSGFAGLVIRVVPQEPLLHMLASLDVGAGGLASLRSAGMEPLIDRRERIASGPRLGAGEFQVIGAALQERPDAGVLWTTRSQAGFEGVMAYRRLSAFPIYVVAGAATADLLARWRRNSWVAALFAVLFVAISWTVARSAAAAQRDHERARRLYDEAPCGYHSVDARGLYIHVNATELGWLGCQRDEVVNKLGPRDFLDPAGQATFDEKFRGLFGTAALEGVEFDLIGRHGARRRVLFHSKAVRSRDGTFERSNTVVSDISAQHEARKALEERQSEQAAMLDTDLVGIAKLKGGRVVWANRGIERIFGFGPGETHGLPIGGVYPDAAHFEQAERDRFEVRGHERNYRVQRQMVRSDGAELWIDINGTQLSDDPDDLMVMLIDITPLKQAQAQHLRAVELNAQSAQLRETDRLKTQFLANMSHELRTPLNAVIGFAELIHSGVVPADSPKFNFYVSQIGASGAHLLQLIDSMLDFARAESAKIEFNPEALSLRAATQDVVDMLQAKCERLQVTIRVDVAVGLGQIEADPVRLRQVLLNFLGNAVKFSRVGGQVAVRAFEDGASRFTVEVEDGGIGIAESDLPRMFTRFEQLSEGAAKRYQGTGLGLALVRRLVELQGGSVGVKSVLGAGSVFHFTLPRRVASGDA